MPSAARLNDMHTCPLVNGTTPHAGGPIMAPCAQTVLISNMPAARVGDNCICTGHTDTIIQGSATVYIEGLPAARQGDMTAQGGVIISGDATVLIGG